MPLNNLFPNGSQAEQSLTEDLIIESIRMYGREFFYIPRTLVAPDAIFGEDVLSTFKESYMIECYIDNVEEWGGQGGFISKFGYTIEDQGQLTIARRRWEQLIGRYGQSLLPDRPTEGDLMYFPLAKSLFEIKYVEHQNPFYQLGKLYVYKLKIELFQYSSERINTEIDELNQIALDMTFDVLNSPTQDVIPAKRDFFTNDDFKTEATSVLNFDERNPFGEGSLTPVSLPFNAKHIIISYTHSNVANLNTRTRIMSMAFGGEFLGFGMLNTFNNIITWGGDNRGSGSEYVYIDIDLLKATYPDLPTIDIDCRALWVDPTHTISDMVMLNIVGYEGGTLVHSGTTFSITGATATKTLVTSTQIVTDTDPANVAIGQRMIVAAINTLIGTGSIVA